MLHKICLCVVLLCLALCAQGKNPNGDLFRAIANEDYPGVVTAIKQGADPNIRRKTDRVTPLIEAGKLDNLQIMNYLLSKGAHVNAQDNAGRSALFWVVEQDRKGKNQKYGKDMARALIHAGANLNLRDDYDYTVLMVTAIDGQTEMARILARKNTINTQDNEGRTALMHAAWHGKLGVVRVLLQAGANPNLTDKINYDALHWAVFHGHTAVVKELLKWKVGPSLMRVDVDGDTPLATANEKGYKQIAALLRKAGATR